MLEEVNMRMNESKKDTRDFKRDVIIGAENPRTGRTMSDKFIKCESARLAGSAPQRCHHVLWLPGSWKTV